MRGLTQPGGVQRQLPEEDLSPNKPDPKWPLLPSSPHGVGVSMRSHIRARVEPARDGAAAFPDPQANLQGSDVQGLHSRGSVFASHTSGLWDGCAEALRAALAAARSSTHGAASLSAAVQLTQIALMSDERLCCSV